MSDKSFKIELKTPLTATPLHKAPCLSKLSIKKIGIAVMAWLENTMAMLRQWGHPKALVKQARATAADAPNCIEIAHFMRWWGTDIIGTITVEKLEEIAKIKLADLNCDAKLSGFQSTSECGTLAQLNWNDSSWLILSIETVNWVLNLTESEDISRAMKIVHGTAVASGIKVEGYEEWLATSASRLRIDMASWHPKHEMYFI